MKLTVLQFDAIKEDWKKRVESVVKSQIGRLKYKDDMEREVFEDDIADQFMVKIKKTWDVSEFDDFDLIGWIRDIQHALIIDSSLISIPLDEYIQDKFNGSQKRFADAQGVKPAQVTQWLGKGFIVVDDTLYSPRRNLEPSL